MLDSNKTNAQLVAELNSLRQRIVELEAGNARLLQVEGDLRASEKRYADAIAATSDAIWEWDMVTNETYYSPRWYEMLGYEDKKFDMNLAVWEHLCHPEDLTKAKSVIRAHLSSPGSNGYIADFRMRSAEGHWLWIQGRGKVIQRDALGNPMRISGTNTDISERKKAEESIRISEERLRRAEHVAGTGNWEIDLTTKTVHASEGAKSIYSFWAEKMTLEDIQSVPLPEYRSILDTALRALIEKGEPYSVDFKVLRPTDGKLIDVSSVATYDSARNMVFGVIQDITERRRMQDIMVQTEKMMSVGGLAAGMAHEINNPLGGILQNVQVLLRKLTVESQVNNESASQVGCKFSDIKSFMEVRGIISGLHNIRESGERAAHVVKDMLEFSRRSESRNAPSRIDELINKAVEFCSTDYDLKKSYDFKNIIIIREFHSDLPEIPCSKTQIQQVMINLLGNAAHALIGVAAPQVILRACKENGCVRIEIEDNGPGMDESTRRKIFEPFFTTKPVGEGTGLGLSVSYFIIANNHRGTIEVESSPGCGAKFIIRLPLSKDANENPALQSFYLRTPSDREP